MPPAVPAPPSPSALQRCEQALSLMLSDGAAAAQCADEVIADVLSASPAERALALAVRSLYDFREGVVADGLQRVAAGQALLAGCSAQPGDGGVYWRAADWLQHCRAQGHRREGELAEAEQLMQALHARASQRPAADAYFTAAALGTVVSMRGDDDGALDLFYQALGWARRSGQDGLLVNALNNLGSTQSDLFNLDDAEPLLRECLALALKLGSRRQVIYGAGNLVQCLCLMGRASEALEIARAHLIGQISATDHPSLHRDEEIAQVLLDNGLVDEAEAVLGGAVWVDPLSNEQDTIRVWLTARLLLARGRAAEALALCQGRQQLLASRGEAGTAAFDRVSLLRTAALAAHQTGEHALAYSLLEQALAKHELLLGRAARSRQLSLQISHRLRQAEWERDSAQQLAARLEALNSSLKAQVAETERLQALLRAQALEDPLTGLHNRRHLMDAGTALLALMRRQRSPLALLLIDLDHFKRINDRHGHAVGDAVLQGFAALVRRETRTEDIVCRHGGEEFVLMLPGASAPQAVQRGEQLLARFAALRFAAPGEADFGCSFSAGVAVSLQGDEALDDLLKQADEALYQAKAAGRAQVRLAGQGG